MNTVKRIVRKPGSMMMGKVSNSLDKNNMMWVGIGILGFITILACLCWYYGNGDGVVGNITDGFSNIMSKFGKGNSELKELSIFYFMKPECPWCQKMDQMLKDSGAIGSLTVVDVTTPQGMKLATEMGSASKGVPSFISKKLRTGTVGFKPTVQELIDALNKTQPLPPPQEGGGDPGGMVEFAEKLDIILFASDTCGFCNKLKKEFEEAGVMEKIQMVDVSTTEGSEMAKQLIKSYKGVPVCYSKQTQKHVVGYKPISQIIEGLAP